jgi:hypothetical protein
MISRTPRTRYFVGRRPHLYLVDRDRARRLLSPADRLDAATAILAHTQGQLASQRLAAAFAADVLAPLGEDGFVLDERDVRAWVRRDATPPRRSSRRPTTTRRAWRTAR